MDGLKERVKFMERHFTNYLQKNNSDFQSFSQPDFCDDPEKVYFFLGRVVPIYGERLADHNIKFECYLEGDKLEEYEIDIEKLDEFFFFPSQIVVLEGTYQSLTKKIICERIHYDTIVTQEPLSIPQTNTPSYFTMITASGPYSKIDQLNYTSLFDLLKIVKKEKPNLVILTGPFLDESNKLVQTGSITYDNETFEFEDFFDELMIGIQDNVKPSQVIIIPSTTEVHHFYPLPQQPYNKKNTNVCRFMSNPCQIIVENDVKIGLASADFLQDVMMNNYRKIKSPNFGEIILQKTLNQRNFYPIYPGQTMIDPTNYEMMQMETIPDIFIYQSQIHPKITKVGNTLMINHGRISRGEMPGVYSKISVLLDPTIKITERTKAELLTL